MEYSTSILESFGVLSGFNLAENIWDKYEQFAIPKIEESTIKLRGSLFYLKEISPKEALTELTILDQIIPILLKLRINLETIDTKEFRNFRKVAIEFFDTVDLVQNNQIGRAHV